MCVAACVAAEGAVMSQEGVGVLPPASCSTPTVTVGLVESGWPTWTPGGGAVRVEVVGVG